MTRPRSTIRSAYGGRSSSVPLTTATIALIRLIGPSSFEFSEGESDG